LYYTEKIESTPEWEVAGIYADDGISGVHTKKRDGFNQMIQDCKKHRIDLILTKSISRFARNTLEKAIFHQSRRLVAEPDAELDLILPSDLEFEE
jgi:DNA invertase Pin-like site-specific DNA recombinase